MSAPLFRKAARQFADHVTPKNPLFPEDELGAAIATELQDLSQEKDLGLRYVGLLQIGYRLQKRDQIDWALRVFSSVADQSFSEELARKARHSIDALKGKGAIGPRSEVLASNFTRDIRDPAMVAPMLAGTAVAGLVRAAGLSFLAARPAAWFSRGLGARAGAGTLAFAAEVPTFVASGRAMHRLQGQANATWGRDLAAGALSLGSIKLFSLAGRQGLAQLHGVNEWGAITRGAAYAKFSHPLTDQSALFGGLMSAHWAEMRLGLRPQVDDATQVADTLAAMLSLGAGARLGNGLLGSKFSGKMLALETRTNSQVRALTLSGTDLSPSRLPASIRTMIPLLGLGLYLCATKGQSNETTEPMNGMAGIFSLIDLLFNLADEASKVDDGSIPIKPRKADIRLQRFSEWLGRLDALNPEELESARIHAEDFFKKTSFEGMSGSRSEEIEIGLTAMRLLEAILGKIKPGSREDISLRFFRSATTGPNELAPEALRFFRRSLPHLDSTERAAVAEAIRFDLGKPAPKKPSTSFLLFADTASGLPPALRRAELQEILPLLVAHKFPLDRRAADLAQNRRLLSEFVLFADQIDRETKEGIHDQLRELEKKSAGLLGWLRRGEIDRLRRTLENPPEMALPALLSRFKQKKSTNPLARNFKLDASILEAREVQELLDQEQPMALTNPDGDFSLREYFRQPALRRYLDNKPDFFESFEERGLRDKLIEKLRAQGGYRDAFFDPGRGPKGSAR